MIDIIVIAILLILAFIIAISIILKRIGVHPELYKSRQIYSDHTEKVVKPFFSKEHLLVGKPDSILHTKDGLVPVEVKSSKRPGQPYFSHVMQLISYCLLVEVNREKPKRGLIQYRDGEPFVVEYTDELKDRLLEILSEMRMCIRAKKAPVLEDVNRNKCRACKYKGKTCDIRVYNPQPTCSIHSFQKAQAFSLPEFLMLL